MNVIARLEFELAYFETASGQIRFFYRGISINLWEGKLWIQTCYIPLKNWLCISSRSFEGVGNTSRLQSSTLAITRRRLPLQMRLSGNVYSVTVTFIITSPEDFLFEISKTWQHSALSALAVKSWLPCDFWLLQKLKWPLKRRSQSKK